MATVSASLDAGTQVIVGAQAVLIQFDTIIVWKQGDQRTPHKPLLTLDAKGRWPQPPRGVQ